MPKALIVDDEEKVRKTYRTLLDTEGFQEIYEAQNGEDAGLQLIQHGDIDLVLLDIRMPIVNGMVLFDLIRLNNPHAKIVVTSVYPVADQKRVIDTADAYHDKSEGLEALVSKVQPLMPKAPPRWAEDSLPLSGKKRK